MDTEKILKIIKEIRKSDTGEWLKDCTTNSFRGGEGREGRLRLMRLLDKLYKAADKHIVELNETEITCPKCGESEPVLHCENCGHNFVTECDCPVKGFTVYHKKGCPNYE